MTDLQPPGSVSAGAGAALGAAGSVTVVCAPPGLGAWPVVTDWAKARAEPVRKVSLEQVVDPTWLSDVVGEICLLRAGLRGRSDLIAGLNPPEGTRIVVVDEHGHSVPTINAGVSMIRGGQLLFDRAECAWLLQATDGVPADDEVVDALMAATLGWPRPLLAAVATVGQFGSSVSTESLEYAVREAMREDVVPWMEGFSEGLVDYLAAGGEVAFSEIEQNFGQPGIAELAALSGLGVVAKRPHRRGDLFGLSTTLHQILLDRLRTLEPDRYRATLRRIGTTRLQSGVGDQGLAAAYELRDWDLLVAIINRWWIDVTFGGRTQLQRALLAMPESMIRSSPVVAHMAEIAGIIPVASVPVPIPLKEKEIVELARSDRAREFVMRTSAALGARRWRGHFEEAQRISRLAAEVVDRTHFALVSKPEESEFGAVVLDLKTYWYLQAGMAAQLADDPQTASRWFRQGMKDADFDRTGFAARDAALKTALLSAVTGDLDDARVSLSNSERWPNELPYAWRFMQRSLRIAEHILAVDAYDATALDALAETLPSTADVEEMWPFLLWTRVRQALMEGAPERGLALVEETPEHHRQTAGSELLHAGMLRMLQVETRLALGHAGPARLVAQRGLATRTFGRTTEARLALLTGDPETARHIAASTALDLTSATRVRTESTLIQAAAELALGLEKDAAQTAGRAARAISGTGLTATVLAVPGPTLLSLASLSPTAAKLQQLRERLDCHDIYPESVDVVRLSEREGVVLRGLADGILVEDLAQSLFVSPNTIKTQMRSLYAKLGVTSRKDAVRKAHELGLV